MAYNIGRPSDNLEFMANPTFVVLKRLPVTLIVLSLFTNNVYSHSEGSDITIAVASNFLNTMKKIVSNYQETTGHKVHISGGATGKHYAQILHGAPYDVFFSADELRPTLLEEKSVGIKGTRFTYAMGTLIVWSHVLPKSMDDRGGLLQGKLSTPIEEITVQALRKLLNAPGVNTVAFANPKLAPYGKAASEVLESVVPEGVRARTIRGENIGQTFQFLMSGNVDLAFVAHSQVAADVTNVGYYRKIPSSLYSPLKQQAIQLNQREHSIQFVEYVKSPAVSKLIKGSGYGIEGELSAR